MRKFVASLVIAGFLLGLPVAGFTTCNSKDACIKAGMAAYKKKDYEKAKEFFKKAIQFDPKCEKAWRYYDRTLRRMFISEEGEEAGGC